MCELLPSLAGYGTIYQHSLPGIIVDVHDGVHLESKKSAHSSCVFLPALSCPVFAVGVARYESVSVVGSLTGKPRIYTSFAVCVF